MESNDNFYVFLPSNSSSQFFKDNTHSSYKVQLPRPIDLNGAYEVALVQSFFLSNWYNITDDDGKIIFTNKDANEYFLRIKEGYYKTAESLVEEINFEIQSNYSQNEINPVKKHAPNEESIDDLVKIIEITSKSAAEVQRKQVNLDQSLIDYKITREKYTKIAIEHEISKNKLANFINEVNNRKKAFEEKIKHMSTLIKNKETAVAWNPLTLPVSDPQLENLRKENEKERNEHLLLLKQEEENLKKLRDEQEKWQREYIVISEELESKEKVQQLEFKQLLELEKIHKNNLQTQEDAKNKFKKTEIASLFPKLLYDNVTRKVSMYLPSKTGLTFSKALQRMLGYDPNGEIYFNQEEKEVWIKSTNTADLTTDLNSIYIYCNIIESQYVGDQLVPILRIVHLTDTDGVRVTKNFLHPFYMPVIQRHINVIEINISDAYGRLIRFSSGDVVLNVLHFRRVKGI